LSNLTLEDIAREAGVSRATVSRVVNDYPYVRDDVRKRVLEVIESTGYHPNAAARTLASQRSSMIGLVLPRSVSVVFTDPYFPYLTQGIGEACNKYDYTLAFFLVGTTEDEEKIFPRVSRKGLLDGILVQEGVIGDHLIDRLITSQAPLVIVGRPHRSEHVSYIDVNNVDAAYKGVIHLIGLGYERVGTISGPANSTVSIDRMEGYLKALNENGIPYDDHLIAEGDFTEEGGYRAMKTLLTSKPDAVFAASDLMAAGAMRAVREAGLSIPDDVAFVGFDDLTVATLSNPLLTTIRQPVVHFGVKAVEMLIDLIENGIEPVRRLVLDTELIVRDSCGASKKRT
jgi:LacI family transcriptional regulator